MAPLPLVYHPDYGVPLPEGHRFPMAKFQRLYETLSLQLPGQFRAFTPHLPLQTSLELVHDPNFIQDYCLGTLGAQEQRRIGLPWSEALVKRTLTAVGGTLLTARLALTHGIALNTAGGTHHAYPTFGSGFCIFNDFAIAARVLLEEGKIQRVLILDLDVHQGDGTAYIFAQDPRVFTVSIHCEKNFPHRKQPSDLDLALPEGTSDQRYLKTLRANLPTILTLSQPDLMLYNAGADPHRDDRLGKLALTDTGLLQRDCLVLDTCRQAKLPVACVIGGGYDRDLQRLVNRHALLFWAAHHVFQTP
ncbi:histone deacetylase family protein [Lyngbya confervoides]|uniref:Histone deacetylase n=1 Tax=Lyngbya confervoides BDU141951 TaxID=1574623 RepID=A0ABD4T5W2_9CYAN|nr:histone deacetylase [Lyngbya confervoides]MCM1984171.1 histone deacetylase [Lyngbya confervoides BDU141951]